MRACAILVLFWALPAKADKVIFFAGAMAEQGTLNKCFPKFENHPPHVGEAAVIKEIDSNPNEKFIVVGHSEGSASAMTVVGKVKDPSRVTLVNLDGWNTARLGAGNKAKRVCWNAESTSHPGLKSRGYKYMYDGCTVTHTHKDSHCSTNWCLHFSLVNGKTPADLSEGTFGNGYANCDGNVEWASGQ